MLTSFQRRRFLLFLIAILLPSSLLVLLTWRLIGQQAELDEKRLAESRRRYALDIGQQLLARLEQIKLQEVSGAAQGRAIESREYSSRAVALIGLTDGKRLLLPWEANQNFGIGGHSLTHATFVKNIWIAERLELQDGQFDDASQLYLEHVEAAKAIPQQVYARLLRARSLGKAGLVDESLEEFRAVVAERSDVADEHGVPLWLYAARRLVQSIDDRNEVDELIRD